MLEARAVCREKGCPQGSLSICVNEPGRQATMLGQGGRRSSNACQLQLSGARGHSLCPVRGRIHHRPEMSQLVPQA